MSNHPQRYYGIDELHFITCSCYRLQAWLASPQRRDLFLAVFEEVRQRYRFVVGAGPSLRSSVKVGTARSASQLFFAGPSKLTLCLTIPVATAPITSTFITCSCCG